MARDEHEVGRPRAHRQSSGSHRGSPYPRNSNRLFDSALSSTYATETPSGVAASVDKWQHDKNTDLFLPGSTLYKPAVAFGRQNQEQSASAVRQPRARTSDYPAPVQSGLRSSTIADDRARGREYDDGSALTERIGIKGSRDKQTERDRLEDERRARLAEQRRRDEQMRQEQADRKAWELYRRQRDLAERERDAFVVIVEGLVYGTSADDVQVSLLICL